MPRMELEQLIGRWASRLRWQRSLALAGAGLAVGLLGALLLAIAARLTPLLSRPWQIAIAFALALLGLTVALAWPWLRSIGRKPIDWMREFDRRFGLGERLSTLNEIAEGRIKTKIDELRTSQRSDTIATAEGVNSEITTRLPLKLVWRDWIIAGVIAACLLLAIALPNPQDQALADQARMREAMQQQAQQLQQAKDAIQNSALSPEAKRQATEALEQAQQTLNDPNTTPERALAAINDAQSKLDALEDQAARQQEEALRQAGQSMASDELTNNLADALQNGDFERAAEALRNASSRDGKSLTPDEAERTARQLEQLARRTQNTDPTLSQNLRQAAQRMREGNNEAAQERLNQAAQQLQRSQQQQQANRDLDSARNQAEEARQNVARASRAGRSGQQGANAGSEQNKEGGGLEGQESNSDATQNGDNRQSGEGDRNGGGGQQGNTGNQQQAGEGSGESSGQQAGRPTGLAGSGEDTGSDNSVYAPGRVSGQGERVQLPGTDGVNAPNPQGSKNVAPDGQSVVPYEDVYGDYAKAADDAIESSGVPADRRDYVRDYFSSLNPETGSQNSP
jgi:membrane protein implicated in regulation of membrane protease activity